jgi:hypothetical protein
MERSWLASPSLSQGSMKPETMSDDEEGGLRSVRKPPRPAISASVVSDLTPKTAELAHKRVACARKICTTIDHALYHCPMQCTPKPDVSHRKIEERCLPREDEWSAMTHPGWQVQQEALTISQQAPAGGSGAGPHARTNSESKAERLVLLCFE